MQSYLEICSRLCFAVCILGYSLILVWLEQNRYSLPFFTMYFSKLARC